MDINLTIILVVMCIVLLWLLVPFVGTKMSSDDTIPYNPNDTILVQNYYKKPSYDKKVVLVIEEAQDVDTLVLLIRNILTQEIKVDSIVLVTPNDNLKKVHLIRDTCVFNKVGGLTFLFKESSNQSIIIFVFPHGFNAFTNSQTLRQVLYTDHEISGLTKVETNTVNIDIDKVYYI